MKTKKKRHQVGSGLCTFFSKINEQHQRKTNKKHQRKQPETKNPTEESNWNTFCAFLSEFNQFPQRLHVNWQESGPMNLCASFSDFICGSRFAAVNPFFSDM